MNYRKWIYFEFWPSWLIYSFTVPIFVYGVLKTKKLTFFTTVNPKLPTGGFFGEDKVEINKLFSANFRVKEIDIPKSYSIEETKATILESGVSFPLYAKLKTGERGRGVVKIENFDDLEIYQKEYPNFYIQEEISNGEEVGIFYIKNPWEKTGKITSIVTKKYPQVIGDGVSTIKELIEKDKRLKLYKSYLLSIVKTPDEVIPKNEIRQIHQYGNHCKGTQFIDGKNLHSKEMESLIDSIFSKVEGIYYGRLDVKIVFQDNKPIFDSLKIIEFNGVIAEPAHIYGNRWFFCGVRDIYKHWNQIIKICDYNIKKGAKTAPLSTLFTTKNK